MRPKQKAHPMESKVFLFLIKVSRQHSNEIVRTVITNRNAPPIIIQTGKVDSDGHWSPMKAEEPNPMRRMATPPTVTVYTLNVQAMAKVPMILRFFSHMLLNEVVKWVFKIEFYWTCARILFDKSLIFPQQLTRNKSGMTHLSPTTALLYLCLKVTYRLRTHYVAKRAINK